MALTILYAEDNPTVAEAVKDTLEAEGWRVDACADGLAALAKLEGEARYGLLLFDNELPGMSGLELARRARVMAHRSRTPIIVLSASEAETDAHRAGANAFLRKPQDITRLVETVEGLVKRGHKG